MKKLVILSAILLSVSIAQANVKVKIHNKMPRTWDNVIRVKFGSLSNLNSVVDIEGQTIQEISVPNGEEIDYTLTSNPGIFGKIPFSELHEGSTFGISEVHPFGIMYGFKALSHHLE